MHWTNYEETECECDHEHFDFDILTGRATCEICGDSWYPSKTEIEAICAVQEIDFSDPPHNTVVCHLDENDEIPF